MEIVRGDQKDPTNPFHWHRVLLNLPGDKNYDPRKPRLSKLQGVSDNLAAQILSYVDDMRAAAGTEMECWYAMHWVATTLNYLGIQIAARKTRPPSKHPGPWAGSMMVADATGVGVKATQEKWDKMKGLLLKVQTWIENGNVMRRKELESIRGSLVYLQWTYPAITPYVKGFHLTIDAWRPGRDEEGWKVTSAGPRIMEGGEIEEPPVFVRAVPCLKTDILMLLTLLDAPEPPIRYVRSNKINVVLYDFGDASGSGFGRTMGNAQGVTFTHGLWGIDEGGNSSNYRELANLVETLEEGVRSDRLANSEVWIFTDNSTAESVFWKGHSSSPRLNELALRLRQLEMGGKIKIHMVHIAGTRMIAQGTDGLSRGDATEGVMTGQSILNFIPLNKTALERRPDIRPWIESWVPSQKLTFLTPESWCTTGHGTITGSKDAFGVWIPQEMGPSWLIWCPPPAIADLAVDELEESRHKRKHLSHIFLTPRLLTFAWRKKLFKICDLVFEIPPGSRPFWPSCEHEPLIVGLTLRFSSCSPWQVKRGADLLELDRALREVWKIQAGDERSILRQFCLSPERMDAL